MFEAINNLTFAEDRSVNEMTSKEGESLSFVDTMYTEGKNVEAWMTEVRGSLRKCAFSSEIAFIGFDIHSSEEINSFLF